MPINRAASEMPGSGIREIMDRAWGRPDVIRLEVGEPDFPTPAHVVEAAHTAALEGQTGYTPAAGIPALREALAAKVTARNGYTVAPQQVVVAQGGVNAIYASLLSLTRPGDEVLLPDPAWPNFLMMARLLGLTPLLYPLTAAGGYTPQLDDLERLVSPRTTVMLLNSPSNPVGAVIDAQRMTELLAFAGRHDLWTVSDECYDEIHFDGTFVSAAAVAAERVVSCYSFSKTYAMTGWRVGYTVAPAELAAVIARCEEPLLSCVNTPAQYAALAAVSGAQEIVATMREAYRARREVAMETAAALGLPAFRPAGAFYMWVDVSAAGMGSRALALRLLDERAVAVAPGTAFGAAGEGFVRISLASSEWSLREGLARLADLVRTT